MVHEGDYIRAATSEPLVTINQIHPVRVRFTVPETDVPMVQQYRNRSPRVIVTPSSVDSVDLTGALVFVDNAVDPTSGTLMLKGEFKNLDERLVPGQFVKVRLVLYEDPNATVVPAPAVTAGQEGSFVYVLNPDSTVTPRPVDVARTVDELAIVQRGLQPGEVVVTDGQLRLSPGAKVLIRDERANRAEGGGRGGPQAGAAAADGGRGGRMKNGGGAAQAAEREGAKGGGGSGGSSGGSR
jgi:multidrug efflux system membrane fusion protein